MVYERPQFVSGKVLRRHVWIDKKYQGPGLWEVPEDALTADAPTFDRFVRAYLTRKYGDDFFPQHTLQTGNPESDNPRHEALLGLETPF